jgi:Ca-activated chloride channel family protein
MAGSGGVTQQGFFSQRIPPLNDRLLKSISEKTGGRFYRADSEEKLKEIWAEISSLEKTEINARQYMDWNEKYFLLVLSSLVMLLLAFVLKYVFWRTD